MTSKRIKLTKKDEKQLLSYIADEPEVNLFISGDVYAYGLDGEIVAVWAYLDEKGSWLGVLLRYMKRDYVFYSRSDDFPVKEIASSIKRSNRSLKGVCLSGKKKLIDRFVPFLSPLKEESAMMARCDRVSPSKKVLDAKAKARLLGKSDFHDLFGLFKEIKEFATSSLDNEADSGRRWAQSLSKGSAIIGVFVDKVLVATAGSTADSPAFSMLVGVATRPAYRRKGYASFAVQTLLENRFAQGQKFLCLFYDNPEAGRIYHKFGFADLDAYAMLR
jgi:predicted GNAT family acetyltransferase